LDIRLVVDWQFVVLSEELRQGIKRITNKPHRQYILLQQRFSIINVF